MHLPQKNKNNNLLKSFLNEMSLLVQISPLSQTEIITLWLACENKYPSNVHPLQLVDFSPFPCHLFVELMSNTELDIFLL